MVGHSIVATASGSAHWTAEYIIKYHWCHPVVALVRVVLGHHAVPRLGKATDLHAAYLAPAHVLGALGAPDAPGGVPHGLFQVSIAVLAQELLIVCEALCDLVSRIHVAPCSRALVLGKFLTPVGLVMLGLNVVARGEQLLDAVLCVGLGLWAPLQVPVRLAAVLPVVAAGVPVPPVVVSGPPPLAATLVRGGDPVKLELEVVVGAPRSYLELGFSYNGRAHEVSSFKLLWGRDCGNDEVRLGGSTT